jgi:hypothetical protein
VPVSTPIIDACISLGFCLVFFGLPSAALSHFLFYPSHRSYSSLTCLLFLGGGLSVSNPLCRSHPSWDFLFPIHCVVRIHRECVSGLSVSYPTYRFASVVVVNTCRVVPFLSFASVVISVLDRRAFFLSVFHRIVRIRRKHVCRRFRRTICVRPFVSIRRERVLDHVSWIFVLLVHLSSYRIRRYHVKFVLDLWFVPFVRIRR